MSSQPFSSCGVCRLDGQDGLELLSGIVGPADVGERNGVPLAKPDGDFRPQRRDNCLQFFHDIELRQQRNQVDAASTKLLKPQAGVNVLR